MFTHKTFEIVPDKTKRHSKEVYIKVSIVHNGFKWGVKTSEEIEFSFKGVSG